MSIGEHLDKALDGVIALLFPPPPEDCEYCPDCGGTGQTAYWGVCPHCHGIGYVHKHKDRQVKHV